MLMRRFWVIVAICQTQTAQVALLVRKNEAPRPWWTHNSLQSDRFVRPIARMFVLGLTVVPDYEPLPDQGALVGGNLGSQAPSCMTAMAALAARGVADGYPIDAVLPPPPTDGGEVVPVLRPRNARAAQNGPDRAFQAFACSPVQHGRDRIPSGRLADRAQATDPIQISRSG